MTSRKTQVCKNCHRKLPMTAFAVDRKTCRECCGAKIKAGHRAYRERNGIPHPEERYPEYYGLVQQPGFVYLIQSSDGGPVKIGRSIAPHKRLARLREETKQDLVIIALCEGGSVLEARLHNQLRKFRLNGEWFKPDISIREMASNDSAWWYMRPMICDS